MTKWLYPEAVDLKCLEDRERCFTKSDSDANIELGQTNKQKTQDERRINSHPVALFA